MKKNYIVFIVAVLVLIAFVVFLGGNKPAQEGQVKNSLEKIVIEKDQTFTEDYTVPRDKNLVVKNGAKITFEKNLTVSGLVSCEGGPLNLAVRGQLKVDRYLHCDIGDSLKKGEAGNGIMIVAGSVDVGNDAVIVSNGSVQIVSEQSKLATTIDAVNKIYDEAGKWTKEGRYFGPFLPFDEMPNDVSGRPTSQNVSTPSDFTSEVSRSINNPNDALASGPLSAFIPVANAADIGRATDIEGDEVKNTIRIGGTWVIGSNPPGLVPEELKVPTPPAGIKRIILNFNFGEQDVNIGSFTLYGPEGRPGTEGELNCDSKGGRGENAMRLNVNASGITIGNFEIHLGSGGAGGDAGSGTDCEHGRATGGNGGEGGNIKMMASSSISINGSMNIFPGVGGRGGDAYAYGKNGIEGCAGAKGGDATARGGDGADNKKGLMVSGAVTGAENVTIHEIIGGAGGLAAARAGNGGNGTGPKCAGGEGGKATATGGKGGDTQSVKATSVGGSGGFVQSYAGNGGNGGMGTSTQAGGKGGKGGDALSKPGNAGQGTTSNGAPGEMTAEQGGNGGNGGDGCGPGSEGNAGIGTLNLGLPGSKGKDLCVIVGEENKTTTGEISGADPIFDISGPLSFTHTIGTTSCPQNIGTVSVTGSNIPAETSIKVEKPTMPGWMTALTDRMNATIRFNCQLEKYENQELNSDLKVVVVDAEGKTLKELNVNVSGNIKK